MLSINKKMYVMAIAEQEEVNITDSDNYDLNNYKKQAKRIS